MQITVVQTYVYLYINIIFFLSRFYVSVLTCCVYLSGTECIMFNLPSVSVHRPTYIHFLLLLSPHLFYYTLILI